MTTQPEAFKLLLTEDYQEQKNLLGSRKNLNQMRSRASMFSKTSQFASAANVKESFDSTNLREAIRPESRFKTGIDTSRPEALGGRAISANNSASKHNRVRYDTEVRASCISPKVNEPISTLAGST